MTEQLKAGTKIEVLDLNTKDGIDKLCGRLLAVDLFSVAGGILPEYLAGTKIDAKLAAELIGSGLDTVEVEAMPESLKKPRGDSGQASAFLDEVLKLLGIFTHQDQSSLRRTLKHTLNNKSRLSLADRRMINLCLANMMASNAHYLEKIIHNQETKEKRSTPGLSRLRRTLSRE